MKRLIASILLSLALAMPAAAAGGKCHALDPWSGPDKTKHAIVGAAIGAGGTIVFDDPHKGFLLGAGVGLAKEIFDRRSPSHTCSFQDFAVTALGAAAGAYGTAWVILPALDGKGVFVGYSKSF